MLFWIICRKRRPNSWKTQKLFFCQKLLYFSTRSLFRKNGSFSLRSFHYFNRHLSGNRREEKMPLLAGRLLWIIKKEFLEQIYKMKGNLPLPLAFFTYTSQLHGFLHNFTASQFQIHKNLSPKGSTKFAADCDWHSTISQNIVLIWKNFCCRKNVRGGKVAAECVWNCTIT